MHATYIANDSYFKSGPHKWNEVTSFSKLKIISEFAHEGSAKDFLVNKNNNGQ